MNGLRDIGTSSQRTATHCPLHPAVLRSHLEREERGGEQQAQTLAAARMTGWRSSLGAYRLATARRADEEKHIAAGSSARGRLDRGGRGGGRDGKLEGEWWTMGPPSWSVGTQSGEMERREGEGGREGGREGGGVNERDGE